MSLAIPLFVPGPVTLSDAVMKAGASATVYHQGTEFGRLVAEVGRLVGEVLGTAEPVYCLAGTGTALLETVLRNVSAADEPVTVASNGYFGERLAETAGRLGLRVVHLRESWGAPVSLPALRAALEAGATSVYVVHHETSTGFVNDLAPIARLCRELSAVLVVDCISSAGALPVEMDRVGVDVAVMTSQKGVGGPPGVGLLAISPRAWARAEAVGPPTTLAGDWSRMRAAALRTPTQALWTPPVTVVAALHAALVERVVDVPLPETWRRTETVGVAMRQGLAALGFRHLPTGAVAVPPVTATRPPEGVNATLLVEALRAYGVQTGAGQGELAGEILRISHVGLELFHVFGLLGGMEAALDDLRGSAGTAPAVRAARAWGAR